VEETTTGFVDSKLAVHHPDTNPKSASLQLLLLLAIIAVCDRFASLIHASMNPSQERAASRRCSHGRHELTASLMCLG